MGAPRTTRPKTPQRILDEYGDALYDFALAVTGDRRRAVGVVREAVVAALETHGPGVERPVLFGCVFAAAVREAGPAPLLGAELIEAGPGEPEELQRLARAAVVFLDPVQRGCLDLALRHGLEGEALSQALGVASGLASMSVQAAVDRAEHVIGAVLLARVGRADCPGLAEVTLDSVGMPAEKLAAAVVEHEQSCPACGDRRRALVPVTTLLANVPAEPAPAELKRAADLRRRGGIVRSLRPPARPAGLPRTAGRARPGRARLVGAGAAGVGLVVATVAVAVLWPHRGGEIAPTAAPGGQLAVDAGPVDFGPAEVEAEIRIGNTGREPLVFELAAAAPWISFVGGQGTIDPGASAVAAVVLDRSRAPEGAAEGEIRVRSNGGSAVLPVRAVVERAPEVSGLEVTPPSVVVRRCPGSTPAHVRAAVVEESGLTTVELHWVRGGMAEQASPMTAEGTSTYRGALGPFDTPGRVHWWVTAVDIRSNRVQSPPQELRVGGC